MSALEEAVAQLAKALAPAIAAEVVAQLRAGETPGMVDQSTSPLGRRRHIAAVRRMVAAGDPGAAQVGRRYLLTTDAVQVELSRMSRKPKAPAKGKAEAPVDELAAMRARYGFEKAGAA